MAEVFIAAAPGEDAQARGLAEALAILGFDAGAGAPAEADIAKTVDGAKCVVALWSRGAANAPWLAALGVLALERKKLICAELNGAATPAPMQAAPRVELALRDRAKFKARFQSLIAEIDKLAPTKGDAEKLPGALAAARTALLKRTAPGGRAWATPAVFVAGVAALFALGFGAGRLINAVRSGQFLVAATPSADAAPARAAVTPAGLEPDLSRLNLETRPWREAAADIDAAMAALIRTRAAEGDARAQSLACLGHLAGAEDFLPSPSAAREQCDAAAAQSDPAGLYLSWVLQRHAPHAGIDDATARARLAEAARLGWIPAQIDYASALASDARAPLEAQAEAGRLWLAAAERGDPRGQYHYARWLRDSAAGPRDPAAAVPYLERAANRGQVEALHMLATFYRDGIGVARNEGRARALYEQAARDNHPPSMFNLADMLRRGSDAERARAVELYQGLACMRDEVQIQALAQQRLRALRRSAACR